MSSDGIGFEIVLILLMILANGVFAMSELAIISSRKSRLQHLADAGLKGAQRALDLANHPNRFLSTVQIGITMVGIFAGAYGGATIAAYLDASLEGIPALAPYSRQIAFAVVVLAITYLSLVIGELVPKRIALTNPERIAALLAGPMAGVSTIAAPLVKVLSVSTDVALRLLGIHKTGGPPVTEAEITSLIEQGTKAGVFEEEEQDLVERVFWLGDQRVSALMTPRGKIVAVDVNEPEETLRAKLIEHRHSRFLVYEREIDHVLGMVEVKDLLARILAGEPLDLRAGMRKPLFVPESLRALRLLELFRESGVHMAVVIDEYGGVEGIVTLNDVLEEIAGKITSPLEPRVVLRNDGSWLVDGTLAMDDLWETLGLEERRGAERGDYHTVAGFVFTQFGHVPSAGEWFTLADLRIEVVDMDGNRIDKVLITRGAEVAPEPGRTVP